MFDYTDYLSINLGPTYETGKWQYRLPYNQDCSGLFPTKLDVGDGVYSTCKLTDGEPIADVNGYGYSRQNGDVTTGTLFSASFFSKSKHITGFFVYGNLGADGGGASLAMNLTGPLGTYGYYKQVCGAGSDPVSTTLRSPRTAEQADMGRASHAIRTPIIRCSLLGGPGAAHLLTVGG